MTSIQLLSAVCLLAGPGAQHHGAPKVSPNSNWVRSSVPPLVLARQVEARLHTLTMASLEYQFAFKGAIGKGGMKDQCLFAGPKQFHIQYPLLGSGKFPIQQINLVSDGRLLGRKSDAGGKVQITALPPRRSLPSDLVKDWFYSGVGDLFTAVGSSTDPLSALVRAATKPGSGYECHSETRTVVIYGKPTRYDRIVVSRTPEATQKRGSLFYEIAINDHYKLPTSMSNTIHEGKAIYTSDMTNAVWLPVRTKLDPNLFDPRRMG